MYPKIMKNIAQITCILTMICVISLYILKIETFEIFAIVFGTICYHFTIRIVIGNTIDGLFDNVINYKKKCFKTTKMEMKIYKLIGVKKWKDKLPTYYPELFSLRDKTLDKVIMAMCQAEIVHQLNCVFSILTVIASIWFGMLPVFLATGILAGMIDLIFVIVQRYNRTRMIKVFEKIKEK